VVIVLRQVLRTRRPTGRLHKNRRHRRRRRPQYRAGMTVHYTALMLVVTLRVGVFDHDRFDSARIRRCSKGFALMMLHLQARRSHRWARRWAFHGRLAADLRLFEVAPDSTLTAERARVADELYTDAPVESCACKASGVNAERARVTSSATAGCGSRVARMRCAGGARCRREARTKTRCAACHWVQLLQCRSAPSGVEPVTGTTSWGVRSQHSGWARCP